MKKRRFRPHISLLLIAGLLGGGVLIASNFLSHLARAASASVSGQDYFGISSGGTIQFLTSTELSQQLDGYKDVGAKWLRFDFAWTDIQSGGAGGYNWSRYDAVVNAANARGIKILGMIGYTPTWARPSGCTSSDKCAPANAADYGTFAGAAAARYAPLGVHYWEIWNEPNNSAFWKPSPNPAIYTQVLRAGYQSIKAADSGAVVVSGGFAPAPTDGTNYAPVDFLSAMYTNGAKNYFDAVGHHPYCYSGAFDCPKTYAPWSAWSQMQDSPNNLRTVMTANGDSAKKIWGTEFGAPTQGSGAVTEVHQASMVSDAYALWRSYSFTGPLFWYSYHDIGTNATDREDWFGLTRFDYSHKLAYDSYKNATAPYTPSTPAPTAPKSTTTQPPPREVAPAPTAKTHAIPAQKKPVVVRKKSHWLIELLIGWIALCGTGAGFLFLYGGRRQEFRVKVKKLLTTAYARLKS